MKQTHKGLISWKKYEYICSFNIYNLYIFVPNIFFLWIYFCAKFIFPPVKNFEMGNWSQLEFNLFCSFVWSMNAIKAIVKWKHFRGRISVKKKKLFLYSDFSAWWFFFQWNVFIKIFSPTGAICLETHWSLKKQRRLKALSTLCNIVNIDKSANSRWVREVEVGTCSTWFQTPQRWIFLLKQGHLSLLDFLFLVQLYLNQGVLCRNIGQEQLRVKQSFSARKTTKNSLFRFNSNGLLKWWKRRQNKVLCDTVQI